MALEPPQTPTIEQAAARRALAAFPPDNQPRSQLGLIADEFAKLHTLRAQARADMRLLNKRLSELESILFAKMRAGHIGELQIQNRLVVTPCERFSLVVKPTRK